MHLLASEQYIMQLVTVPTELLGRLCITPASYSTDPRSKRDPDTGYTLWDFSVFSSARPVKCPYSTYSTYNQTATALFHFTSSLLIILTDTLDTTLPHLGWPNVIADYGCHANY